MSKKADDFAKDDIFSNTDSYIPYNLLKPITLWYQIIVQQILLFFWQNAYLHALISSYTIIYFSKKILPTQLFHPTQLFISFKNLGNSKFSALFKPLITKLGQKF